MRLRIFTVAALAAAAVASQAAAIETISAKLEAPLAAAKRPVAGGEVWACSGDTCTAQRGARVMTVMGCRELAREVGAVSTYGNDKKSFSAEQLASCNVRVKK